MPVDSTRLDLPRSPGVYLFKTRRGRVLYVGKASDLRGRVRSYFTSSPERAMVPLLIEDADNVDFIVTTKPDDALILERQLIREHRPRYNSMFKDDRSYPMLALTDEQAPRILYTRRPPAGAKVWGPFTDAGAAKSVLYLLRRHFGIRDCPRLLPQGCLSMHIGLCAAPCIEAEGYTERVDAATRVLDGDASQLQRELLREMDRASASLEYERAGQARNLIRAIRSTLGQKVISSRFYRDLDAIGLCARGELATVTVLHATDGVVQGQESWTLIHRGDAQETICRFISDHYQTNRPPRLILLPVEPMDFLAEWLESRRGSRVELRIPKRGDMLTLRELADANAEFHVMRELRRHSGSLEQRAADDCAEFIGMECLDHVVCFDMAQLQGTARVGASISLRSGRPDKSDYRRYEVRGDSLDDVSMMLEVIERWLKKQESWPDLILLDGGEVHLNSVSRLLERHGLAERIALAALAKREETLHRMDEPDLILDRRGRLLVHARDEAHRFVNTFHRKRRDRRVLRDPLEAVEGLGAKKLQQLLRHFGGRQGIEHASIRELEQVAGIGPSLAARIVEQFRGGRG